MMSDSDRHETFLNLYVENQRSIYGYLFTMVPNHADAEDLLSETSLTLWRKFDEFEPGTNFVAWACRIAHFKALTHLKSKSRDQLQLSDGVLERLADVRAERGEKHASVRAALAFCLKRLSESDYRLIRSCYSGAQTIKETASQIGRPVSSVYKSLHRIRGSLMQCIERHLRNEEADA